MIEHNLETLFLKHTYAYTMQKNVNKIMPMVKAAQIHFIASGNLANAKFTSTTNYVTNYIKKNIHNESLIDSYNGKVAAELVGMLKSAASFAVLGFSPIQYGRQLMEGFWKDISLMIRKPDGTNAFSFENFRAAFRIVYDDMFHYGDKPSVCQLLNEYYGLNDMDTNTYIDKIKTDQYGFFNFSNVAYHCTSRPDFYNRLMIIVPKMLADGSYHAHSVKEGQLVYDWTKDKRFDVFAKGAKGLQENPEKYNEQKGLYYAIAEQLVAENATYPDGSKFVLDLNNPKPLPKAYTTQEMEGYKSISDNIYGYYSHEKKSMIHALTGGALWMQMRTFWSGKKNQYAGGPGVHMQGHYEQEKDPDGKEYWYKEIDGKMVPQTEENTGVPVMRWKGRWEEGILVTLTKYVSAVRETGSLTQAWTELINDPSLDESVRTAYRANLQQLAYDLVVWGIIGTLSCALLQDWDDELMKEAKRDNKIDESLIAAAAHVAMKCVSGSFMDFNFFESIGSPLTAWQPFSLEWAGTFLGNWWDVCMGDKKFTNALISSTTATNQTKIFWQTLANQ